MDFSICARPIKTLGRRTNKRLGSEVENSPDFYFRMSGHKEMANTLLYKDIYAEFQTVNAYS